MQAPEEMKDPDAGSLTGPRLRIDYSRPVAYTSPLLRTRKTCDALESHAAGTIALLTKITLVGLARTVSKLMARS